MSDCIQQYAIKTVDFVEYYFRGDRYLESRENYLCKTVRILSWGTGVIPLALVAAFLVANALIKPSSDEEYWNEKVIFPYLGSGKKKDYYYQDKLTEETFKITLLKSGISETPFEKIVVVAHDTRHGHGMIFSADGHFPGFRREKKDPEKVLVLHISADENFSKASRKEGPADGGKKDYAAKTTYCRLGSSDLSLIKRGKLPNEVKCILNLNDIEPNPYKRIKTKVEEEIEE